MFVKMLQCQMLVVALLSLSSMGEELSEFEKELVQDLHDAVKRAKETMENDRLRAERSVKDDSKSKYYEEDINPHKPMFTVKREVDSNSTYIPELQLRTIQILKKKRGLDISVPSSVNQCILREWIKIFSSYCDIPFEGAPCNPSEPYRRANGFCNNLANPTWGGSGVQALREIPPFYDDGIGDPRVRARDGSLLAGAREVSNAVFQSYGASPTDPKLTVMNMQWGQFIDHEFVGTSTSRAADGSRLDCCGEDRNDLFRCFPIDIPKYDPFFTNTDCMSFTRSAQATDTPCKPGFRQQLNRITSFIDASTVYGSSQEVQDSLRNGTGGLLRTSAFEMLPEQTRGLCRPTSEEDFCQLTGEGRANMVPSLLVVHTAFMRYHNKIATELSSLNPGWDDERLFQEARKIISAVMQHINYNGYLPSILNQETLKKYDLLVSDLYNDVYDPTINPSISNVFSTAAFRFGHSQVPDVLGLMKNSGEISELEDMVKTFFNPHLIMMTETTNPIYEMSKWLSTTHAPLADALFAGSVRDKLFLSNGRSTDLSSRNIQRGRDHGLPPYNYWRIYCGLEKALMSLEDKFILPDHTEQQALKLATVYNHVDDIDIFVGAMTETHLPDSAVGPTFACLIGSQFERLKKGDRFWYEISDLRLGFNSAQLAQIKQITLAKLLCEPGADLQRDVFRAVSNDNPVVPCESIMDIDLSFWLDN